MRKFFNLYFFPDVRSSSYGYYGGPPYKRQRHLSDEDICPPPGADYSHAAYFDPPYVRHQV